MFSFGQTFVSKKIINLKLLLHVRYYIAIINYSKKIHIQFQSPVFL